MGRNYKQEDKGESYRKGKMEGRERGEGKKKEDR